MPSTPSGVPGHTRGLGKNKQETPRTAVVSIQKTVGWKLPETTGFSLYLILNPKWWISPLKQGGLFMPLTKLER